MDVKLAPLHHIDSHEAEYHQRFGRHDQRIVKVLFGLTPDDDRFSVFVRFHRGRGYEILPGMSTLDEVREYLEDARRERGKREERKLERRSFENLDTP